MKLRNVFPILVGLLLAACSYNTPNHTEQGGAKYVVGSGGEIEVQSGGTLDIQDGATFGTNQRLVQVKKASLSAAATSGGVLTWANPTASTIVVERLILDVTTASTGAATVDCGVVASAADMDDTLIDGLDVNAATGIFDNVENQGTNGRSVKKLGTSDSISCSQKTGDVTGLAGSAYIHYYAQ